MADYNRRNQSSNNRNFGKPRFNRERSEMYSATCANCGKQCEVPFRPTGNKPVFCRECFQDNRGSDSRRSEQRTFDRPHFNRDDNQNKSNYKAQFDELNAKLDKILTFLTPHSVKVIPVESEINAEEIQKEKKKAKPVTKTKRTTFSKKKTVII